MKISTKGEYGIRAMLYLAQHPEEGTVTSHEIACRQGIPEPYLRQMLAPALEDRPDPLEPRTPGGHVLGRPAAEISIRDVIVPLEGYTT